MVDIKSLICVLAVGASVAMSGADAMYAHYKQRTVPVKNKKLSVRLWYEDFTFDDCVGHKSSISWSRAFLGQSIIGGCDDSGEFCVWATDILDPKAPQFKFKVNGVENDPRAYNVQIHTGANGQTIVEADYGKC